MIWIGSILCGIWLGILSIEDWRNHSIPLNIIIIGAAFLIIERISMVSSGGLKMYIVGALCGSSFLLLGKCTNQQLGYGDGLILTILGFYLGSWELVTLLFVAFLLCGIYGIVIKAIKKFRSREGIAFIPFVLFGYIVIESEGVIVRLKGSATVEALYIVPVIFLVFMVAVYLSFFFHDKNVLQGLVYEATLIGSSQYHSDGQIDEEEIREFIEEKSKEKLLFFPIPQVEIAFSSDEIWVYAMSSKGSMEIDVEKEFPLVSPEMVIRRMNL